MKAALTSTPLMFVRASTWIVSAKAWRNPVASSEFQARQGVRSACSSAISKMDRFNLLKFHRKARCGLSPKRWWAKLRSESPSRLLPNSADGGCDEKRNSEPCDACIDFGMLILFNGGTG